MKEYHIGQTVVPYEIEWSDERDAVGLSMDGSMELTVKAPVDASLTDVETALEDKRQWILETLYGLSEQQDPPLNKEFLSGEKLLYNGRRYKLKLSEEPVVEPELQFDGTSSTFASRKNKPSRFSENARQLSIGTQSERNGSYRTGLNGSFRNSGQKTPQLKFASSIRAGENTRMGA